MSTEQEIKSGEVLTLQVPKIDEQRARGPEFVQRANALTIDNDDALQIAGEDLRSIATAQKLVEDTLGPIIKQAHATHKSLTNLRSAALTPFEQARNILHSKMGAYQRKREAEVAAERRRLEELARKQREQQALEEAARAEKEGDKKAAEEIVQAAIDAPAPAIIMAPPVPKIEGTSTRTSYKAVVVDKAKIPLAYMEPDMSAINAVVRKLGHEAVNQIPGIKVEEVTTFATRSY